jgi:glycosyltransferase involved in cell wall biosynthesis
MARKVLITTKPLNHEGGVVNYYRIFMQTFTAEDVELVYHIFGSRTELFYSPWKKRALYPFYYGIDFLRYLWRLVTDRQIRIVQVSPSLIPVPLVRDAFILLVARLLGRKTIVFYRGWREHVVAYLGSHPRTRRLFRWVYGGADRSVVLAERFSEDLQAMGVDASHIRVSSTMFEGKDIRPWEPHLSGSVHFLFLGRIQDLKGIHELVTAAQEVKRRGARFKIVIIGHGDAKGTKEAVQGQVKQLELSEHFEFLGRLSGRNKFEAYAAADVFVLPSWTEGCPTAVLEALGSGLFVVCTDVGAMPEIIQDGRNGKLVRAKDAQDLAEKMLWACQHIATIRERRSEIQKNAFSRFETRIICDQFRNIYRELLDERKQ